MQACNGVSILSRCRPLDPFFSTSSGIDQKLPSGVNRMNRTMAFIAAAAGILGAVLSWPRESRRASGAMSNDVYVWQRAWTAALDMAIAERATNFTESPRSTRR